MIWQGRQFLKCHTKNVLIEKKKQNYKHKKQNKAKWLEQKTK